ncbi:MAG: bifunctional ADP-dependent (S)-NAD(P)H-hydrate dehydratase/NAD(P)H-hydrate epimerase [Bacteroidetes bacterium RIFOXYB2_FULL_35_7]|nr:MAG: bifunctional ADP-dependent (S)-NAD(P)H-hydrate dehydratase/NAD(P)H-hydrate epimerase [Bacteroidetes bacterium GWF2_35_48]OFY92594.1 MAG: bifunctional ADP-dependent (S)-NAD(P)H-hydrate dehydratase/NAD(P)H-hydrate epimerase [Bacteroidetes bacterium RIFOXYB2_FULL_35_7]HBX52414.1 bifunctional ADP-dependent NAD(P)H-hydrate dehydratase/NAD(P)H-hydrate epimerase [Bacteroidales bacterium]
MKVFLTKQTAEIDAYTIAHEPIRSIDLMERASIAFTEVFCKYFSNEKKVIIFIGPGNNGGDGLAVARLLADKGFQSFVSILKITDKLSPDAEINLDRLEKKKNVPAKIIKDISDFPEISNDAIIIDALFGSGLMRPLSGIAAQLVQYINKFATTVVSIDIPSGLMGEDNTKNNPEHIIHAEYTFSFEFPKLSFFFSENNKYTGKWEILPIGLHLAAIQKTETPYYYIEDLFISSFLKKREKFSHKGNYGHALLIAGSYGKNGAAVLASLACLRSGAGLLTTHIPKSGYSILQTSVPEAMVSVDEEEKYVTRLPDLDTFSAIGAGPGLGKEKATQNVLKMLIETSHVPLVLDADALNIVSENKNWITTLPENTILTPHPREFERLFGESESSYNRHLKQIEFSQKHKLIIVLKGAHTSISLPDGTCYFNSTGNPGMATGGSGDVLTGIILSFLAQGYLPSQAALLGVFLHGLAGDLALAENSPESLLASDIMRFMGKAFAKIQKKY